MCFRARSWAPIRVPEKLADAKVKLPNLAEYDRLFEEQTTTVDPQARRQIIWRMQQIVHRDSPYVVLCYPQQLEAYDVSKWAGWVQAPANGGGVVLNQFNIDSYVFAHPVATATSSGENGGSVPTVTWVVIAIAARSSVESAAALRWPST